MIMAAEVGDRSAMIFMAKAFETGIGLGSDRYIIRSINYPISLVLLLKFDTSGCSWIISKYGIEC